MEDPLDIEYRVEDCLDERAEGISLKQSVLNIFKLHTLSTNFTNLIMIIVEI